MIHQYRTWRLRFIIITFAIFTFQDGALAAQTSVMAVSVEAGFRYTRGLEQNIVFTAGADLFPGRVFGFGGSLTLASSPSFVRRGFLYAAVSPVKWADVEMHLGYGNYREYNTAGLSSGLVLDLHTLDRGWYIFSIVTGLNGRFALFEPDPHLPRELIFSLDFNWALSNRFRITRDYTLAFEIGSFHRGRMTTFGYVQMELQNRIGLSESWHLLLDTGAGFAGSFSLAGHINRYWIFAGAAYAW